MMMMEDPLSLDLDAGLLTMELDEPADQVLDDLFLGDCESADNREGLKSLGITHVLNVADDVGCNHPDAFEYLHLQIADGGADESIIGAFAEATNFVSQARKQQGKVLVHCARGVNRSATVTMAVLMNTQGLTLREAYDLTKSCRQSISPFRGNRQKIAQWELQSRGTCTMPEWLPQEQRQKLGLSATIGMDDDDFSEECDSPLFSPMVN